MSRRTVLAQSFVGGGVLLSGLPRFLADLVGQSPSLQGGLQLGVLPFADEGMPPMEQVVGAELDGRLFTDLSNVNPENEVIPTDRFYIRTRASKYLSDGQSWAIRVGGLTDKLVSVLAKDVQKLAKPMGLHVLECAGNTRAAHFGMLSVAEWDGVPLLDFLDRTNSGSQKSTARILVSGFDQYSVPSRTSVPGASWIFTTDQLNSSGAFLATHMNGQPLTTDHGAPLRLVVPGWYGCTCIKWVNGIQFVRDNAPATSQMQEYASRTMQNGVPALAADYQPALMNVAAMPVRVEKWSIGGKIKYRIEGIQWGGNHPIETLQIRFNPDQDYGTVDEFHSSIGDSWNFWSHVWVPPKPGKYEISLRASGAKILIRRLDSGYYNRSVEIPQV